MEIETGGVRCGYWTGREEQTEKWRLWANLYIELGRARMGIL